VIVDTNALSDWAKSDEGLLRILPAEHLLVLPAIVIGEYLFGVLRSQERSRLELWLERTIRAVRVGTITLATANTYADLRLKLHRKGRTIPANDAWIAALALEHGLPVLSRDAHFDVVDGVQRVTW
jgi:tRNA(fMet)-specific endonuclease VapC